MAKRVRKLRIGQRVLEAIGVCVIGGMYITAVTVLRVDSVILSTAVGAIVFILTRKRYKSWQKKSRS